MLYRHCLISLFSPQRARRCSYKQHGAIESYHIGAMLNTVVAERMSIRPGPNRHALSYDNSLGSPG